MQTRPQNPNNLWRKRWQNEATSEEIEVKTAAAARSAIWICDVERRRNQSRGFREMCDVCRLVEWWWCVPGGRERMEGIERRARQMWMLLHFWGLEGGRDMVVPVVAPHAQSASVRTLPPASSMRVLHRYLSGRRQLPCRGQSWFLAGGRRTLEYPLPKWPVHGFLRGTLAPDRAAKASLAQLASSAKYSTVETLLNHQRQCRHSNTTSPDNMMLYSSY